VADKINRRIAQRTSEKITENQRGENNKATKYLIVFEKLIKKSLSQFILKEGLKIQYLRR